MRERLTARVLLFDPAGRILLMKGRLSGAPEAPGVWFTVGGAVDPGETILAAAAREIVEETGFTDAVFGPVVWLREAVLPLAGGEKVLFKESYVVARCGGGEPDRSGWTAVEQALIEDIRWWTPADLAATAEPVYPEGLAPLLPDIAAGRYPRDPVVLTEVPMGLSGQHRLVTYGTLAPGRPNHHQLAGLRGAWSKGSVRGRLFAEGWGAAMGYPGLALDPEGETVAVDLLVSHDLPDHWPRLDAFEGEGYRRVTVQVATAEGEVEACIYVLAQAPPDLTSSR